jgi:hypothetical protein
MAYRPDAREFYNEEEIERFADESGCLDVRSFIREACARKDLVKGQMICLQLRDTDDDMGFPEGRTFLYENFGMTLYVRHGW